MGKKKDQIPMIHDLEKMFKHFSDDQVMDLTKKDFEGLSPADHSYGVHLFFIRQFRKTINQYIEKQIEYSYSRLKSKLENEFENKLDNMIGEKIETRLEKFRKEITDMVEELSLNNKPSVVPPKRRLDSTLENPTLTSFMK
jgi:hypothetical protein|tara:strand:+ start:134 stop:556 length:423 start_codon:yes stop_codon:yes gene_type:complete